MGGELFFICMAATPKVLNFLFASKFTKNVSRKEAMFLINPPDNRLFLSVRDSNDIFDTTHDKRSEMLEEIFQMFKERIWVSTQLMMTL